MKTNHSSINLPFSIICFKSSSSGFEFMINFGSINDFIFSTYKRLIKRLNNKIIDADLFTSLQIPSNQTPDPTTAAAKDYANALRQESIGKLNFSARYENSFIFKLSQKLQKTFATQQSCSVYLTIPKIPVGADLRGVRWSTNWFLWNRTSFFNQFTIEITSNESFEDRLSNNQKYIQKNNPFFTNFLLDENIENLIQSEILSDEEYPGKLYIKLADIIIKGSSYEINYFFRSDLIAPIRWVNFSNLRNFNIYFEHIGTTQTGERKNKNILAHWINFHPQFLLKTVEEIEEGCDDIITDYIEKLYRNTEPEITFGVNYLIILFYMQEANSKIIVKLIKDDFEGYNEVQKEIDESYGEDYQPTEPKIALSENELKEVINRIGNFGADPLGDGLDINFKTFEIINSS